MKLERDENGFPKGTVEIDGFTIRVYAKVDEAFNDYSGLDESRVVALHRDEWWPLDMYAVATMLDVKLGLACVGGFATDDDLDYLGTEADEIVHDALLDAKVKLNALAAVVGKDASPLCCHREHLIEWVGLDEILEEEKSSRDGLGCYMIAYRRGGKYVVGMTHDGWAIDAPNGARWLFDGNVWLAGTLTDPPHRASSATCSLDRARRFAEQLIDAAEGR